MFGHVSPVCRGCLLGPVCLGISRSPVPELGSPLSYLSGRTLARPGPNMNNGRETKHISCHFDVLSPGSFSPSKFSAPYFIFFFSPSLSCYLSSRACCEHLCKIQHGWENTMPISSKQRQAVFSSGLSAQEVCLSLLVHANATQIFWSSSLLGGSGASCRAAGNSHCTAMQIWQGRCLFSLLRKHPVLSRAVQKSMATKPGSHK